MLSRRKIFTISIFALSITILTGFVLLQAQRESTFAQEGIFAQTGVWEENIRCRDPIPSGQAIDETLNVLNDVYRHYKALQDNLDLLVATGEEMTGMLNRDPICDFSVCRSQMISMPPALDVNVCVFCPPGGDLKDCLWCKKLTGICTPACKPLPCYGLPCPPLQDPLKIFEQGKELVLAELEMVHNLFVDPQVELTLDLTPVIKTDQGESVGDKVTRIEFVKRLLELTEKWLTPYTGCVMTPIEREKAARGELTARFPMRCPDALEEGLYWPNAWSYSCQTECQHEATDECIECLKKPATRDEKSWFAKINYRIYEECKGGDECGTPQGGYKQELDADCYNCICQDFQSERDPDWACMEWICGGSDLNLACCEELPLPSVEVIPSPPTVPISPPVGEWQDCLSGADITNPVEQLNDASNDLIKLLNCISQKVPPKDDQGNCQWLISSISDSHGMASCKGDNWPCQCGKLGCDLQDCCYHKQYSCHYGGKDCQGKSYAFDLKWVGKYREVENAARQCGTEVNVSPEVNHTHITISEVACGCVSN